MVAAHSKVSGNRSNGPKGKGKEKSKGGRSAKQCTNCKLRGHVKDKCFAKGGGQEHNTPDWWKEKLAKEKGKDSVKESANAASRDSEKGDNYAFLTIHPADLTSDDRNDEDTNIALVVTSRHDHQAHGVSTSASIILDSGTSSHFSPDRTKFLDYEEIEPEPIKAADGRSFSATGRGDLRVTLSTCNGVKPSTIRLKRVYYAPGMAFTLLSVSCLDKAGCSLLIEDGVCIIRSPRPKCAIIGSVLQIHRLYRLNPSVVINPPKTLYANIADTPLSINKLHYRLGHLCFRTLREMVSKGVISEVTLLESSEPEFCSSCVQRKAHRKAFPKESQTTYSIYGEKVVLDLWGPAPVDSLGEIVTISSTMICLHAKTGSTSFVRNPRPLTNT